MHREGHLDDVYWALRIGLGSTAFLAGLDKFTNLLTHWEKYLAPQVRERLPVSGKQFMYAAGVIEMLVGLGILTNSPRVAGYTASAWLLGIAGNLVLNGDYDIAVRDVNMALAAYAMARSEGSRRKASELGALGEDAQLESAA
jgi:DoxX